MCGVGFHAWKYESSLNWHRADPAQRTHSLVRISEGAKNVTVFGASGNYILGTNTSTPMVQVADSTVSLMGMSRRDDGVGVGLFEKRSTIDG